MKTERGSSRSDTTSPTSASARLSVLADALPRRGDARESGPRTGTELIALSPFHETGDRRLMEAHVVAGKPRRGASHARAVPAASRRGARRVSVAGDRRTRALPRGHRSTSVRRPVAEPRYPPVRVTLASPEAPPPKEDEPTREVAARSRLSSPAPCSSAASATTAERPCPSTPGSARSAGMPSRRPRPRRPTRPAISVTRFSPSAARSRANGNR